MGIFDWLNGNPKTVTTGKSDSVDTLITKYSKPGAVAGNAISQFNYGIALLEGDEFPKDTKAGIDWLTKAANQNVVSAMSSLGNIYAKGLYGINKNFSEAVNWYLMIASKDPETLDDLDSGHRVRAITNLGLIYARGHGDTKYSRHIVKLLGGSGLENTNNIPYMYCLGLIFSNGLAGYEINHDVASTFYLTMIRKDIENSYRLSPNPDRRILIEYSDIDDKHLNFDSATVYLEKMAALGNPKAQTALAIAYWSGWRNVPVSKSIAIKFLEDASAQEDELATKMLSEISLSKN